jgi:hypothetical protein
VVAGAKFPLPETVAIVAILAANLIGAMFFVEFLNRDQIRLLRIPGCMVWLVAIPGAAFLVTFGELMLFFTLGGRLQMMG